MNTCTIERILGVSWFLFYFFICATLPPSHPDLVRPSFFLSPLRGWESKIEVVAK